MAKTYLGVGDPISNTYNIETTGPFDSRSVVDTYDDLFLKETFDGYTYVGMRVTTADTGDVYVLLKRPGKRDDYATTIKWKKLGGSDFDFKSNEVLDYYSQAFGARIVDSVDGLVSDDILFPHKGMLAVVADDIDSSEDESGLYVLIKTPHTNPDNWKKIIGNTNITNQYFNYVVNGDVNPADLNDGITIATDSNTTVQDYVSDNDTIKKGVAYTSYGMGSESGEDVPEYIKIYPSENSESYITLYGKDSDNWIRMDFNDDSFDFSLSSVGDEPYVSGTDVPVGVSVVFDSDIDFKGWIVEEPDGTKSVFGDKYGYDIVDIYRESSLPVAYITVNGTSERVLTESDKTDIEDKLADVGNNIVVEVDKEDGDSDDTKESVTIQQFVNNITQKVTEMSALEEITEDQLKDLF